MQNTSTVNEESKLYSPSGSRWTTYQSFDDYIVAFTSKYLLIDDVKNPEICSRKFLDILKAGANMIQIETSKGMYGASKEILESNSRTAVNPIVHKAVGLVYIRSYLEHFYPSIYQPFKELLEVKFKYEDQNLIFPDWDQQVEKCKKIEDEHEQSKCFRSYLLDGASRSYNRIQNATKLMRESLIGNGTYINHADYDEPNWKISFWGEKNYSKLLKLKKKYDPDNIFRHHFSIR